MAGNIVLPHAFATDVGPDALSLLDTNYNALAAVLNALSSFSNYYVDSGAVNALVVTTVGAQTFGLTDGVVLEVKVANTSTSTTPTLTVNGGAATTIVNADNSPLVGGQLLVGMRIRLIYDLANTVWRLQAGGKWTLSLAKFKPAATPRTSNAILIDPDLQVALPAAGTFSYHVVARVSASGPGGLAAGMFYTGAFSSSVQAAYGVLLAAWAFAQSFAINAGGVLAGGATAGDWIAFDGSIIVTGAGVLSLNWGQNATNATATALGPSSYMTVTQVS
jgi:hypothetical protein